VILRRLGAKGANDGRVVDLLGLDGVEDEAAPGEDVEPEVAALFGPLVVLLG